MVTKFVCIGKSLLKFSSNALFVILIATKTFYSIKSYLTFVYSRQYSQTLYSIPHVFIIIPASKKGWKTDPSNYRPISLLTLQPKVFERVVLDQTTELTRPNKILCGYQSSFRSNQSTDTCLSFLNHKILKGLDDSLMTGMILIDIQKAFDTMINHDTVLKKLSIVGFYDHTVK